MNLNKHVRLYSIAVRTWNWMNWKPAWRQCGVKLGLLQQKVWRNSLTNQGSAPRDDGRQAAGFKKKKKKKVSEARRDRCHYREWLNVELSKRTCNDLSVVQCGKSVSPGFASLLSVFFFSSGWNTRSGERPWIIERRWYSLQMRQNWGNIPAAAEGVFPFCAVVSCKEHDVQ